MVQSTPAQRRNYAPPCKPKGNLFLEAMRAKDTVFKAWSYPTNRSYTGCYACRPITSGTGYSLHAYGPGDAFTHWDGTHLTATALAEDVNAAQNPYGPRLVTDRPRGMVDDMLAIRTNSGAQVFGWGGYYRGNKDAMHDDIVCTPADLRSGISWSTVKGASQEEFTMDKEATAAFAALNAKIDGYEASKMPRIRQYAVQEWTDDDGADRTEVVYVVFPLSGVGVYVPYDSNTNAHPLSRLFSYGIYPADGFHTTKPPEDPIPAADQSSTLFVGGPLASPAGP